MNLIPKILVAIAMGFVLPRAVATTFYVNGSNPVPLAPYTNWPTAATSIQDAVDVAKDGDTVLVTNGIYATGGRRWFDSGTNRVTVTNAVTLRSVNGPDVTLIVGHRVAGTGLARTNAARCVYMTEPNAVVSGFTLTNGQAGVGNYPDGGGVVGGIVTNCVLVGNLATNSLGGGAYRAFLVNCKIMANSARTGGGVCGCTLVNCLIAGNSAISGGGAYGSSTFAACVFTNCTITGNSARSEGGGVNNGGTGVMNNCIVYYNTAPSGSNYTGIKLNYCCTVPVSSGDSGSFTNAPLFVDLAGEDFHLQPGSPCMNAGKNSSAASSTDLDGNSRIVGGTVDIGCYEFRSPASTLSYAWAQQFGLPTDGSADFTDADGDGLNNWQEWIAGTTPTNAASLLRLSAPTNAAPGLAVGWQSVNTRTYFLQRSTSLPAFSTIQSNLTGQAGTTTFMDATATNGGAYFYRIGVQ